METLIEPLVILSCLLASAFFSGSETALLRVRPHEIEQDLRGDRALPAMAAQQLIRSTSRLLVTILVGNNVVNILAASVATVVAVRYLGEERGVIIATVALTLVVLVFCEIAPKALAARSSRRVAYLVALPLYLLHRLLTPIHVIYDRVLEPVLRRVAGGTEDQSAEVAKEVLALARRITADRRHQGAPLSIIANVARAAERTVAEIMIPRAAIIGAAQETPASTLLEDMLEQRYTRVPLYCGSIDDVTGFVLRRDVFEQVHRRAGEDVRPLLKPILKVPARKRVLDLLAEMQAQITPIAIVQDEFGVTLGLVTQEDLLEEIVGEIRDETDHDELLNVRRLSDSAFLVRAHVSVLDVNRETGFALPSPRPGETLAGLMFNALGRVPQRGDRVRLDGYEIAVVVKTGASLVELRVRRLDEDEAAGVIAPPPPGS